MAKSNNLLLWLAISGVIVYALVAGNSASAAPGDGNSMISANQLQQTADFEQFRANAYPDGSANGQQNYSIGFGHNIGPNEQYLKTATITIDQGKQLLLNDMQTVINALIDSGIDFTQGQIDGLADFGFSAGIGAMNKVIATLQQSGPDAATAEMQQYIYWHPVPGGPAVLNNTLVARRGIEVETFNN